MRTKRTAWRAVVRPRGDDDFMPPPKKGKGPGAPEPLVSKGLRTRSSTASCRGGRKKHPPQRAPMVSGRTVRFYV